MSTPDRAPSHPPRYSKRSLPPYRHVPGETPHPERDPAGHMYGAREAAPPDWEPEGWRGNELYLFGVDLFNTGYWWEAHVAWEALWQTRERSDTAATFLQGLIQIAAALVQVRLKHPEGTRRLAAKGLRRLRAVSREAGKTRYMGVDVEAFAVAAERFFEKPPPESSEPPAPPYLVLV